MVEAYPRRVNDERPLTVLGATGYVGGLLVEQARALGLPLRLVGRRREALERIAEQGDEVRVADARHEAELIEAFDGAFAVASTAGPFLDTGTRVVAAAVAVGAHYVDVAVEQSFARTVYEGFGESAEEREVALLPSFGLGYATGDFAARLAAEQLPEPVDEVVVAYRSKGARTSPGTRSTAAGVMRQEQVAWSDGLVGTRFGKTTRRLHFPDGEHGVVEFAGVESLSVPRHTRTHRVRSYVVVPRLAALGGPFAPLFAPVASLAGRIGGPPSAEQRAKWRWTVVAEARSGSSTRRATLSGADVYGLTAMLVARAAEALGAGEVRGAGTLAPAEAFDVHAFLPRLAPFLELDAVETR
jgi:short subunit dehydrogenase-like uncharacterized protein